MYNISEKNTTLHGMFYENAESMPEKVALQYEGKKVTYKELKDYCLRIAASLYEQGVRNQDRVVISLPRGIDQVAAMIAVLTLGAAYVPISVKQPKERKEKMIQNVSPALVIDSMDFLTEKVLQDIEPVSEENTAYIIFTSGSTGNPKGVEISHKAAMNTILDVLNKWNITSQDKVLNVSSFDFDLSVFDIFGLLSAGGCVILINEKDFRDPAVWLSCLKTHQVTIWNSAPALMVMLLTLMEEKVESLRLALLSGDWIPLEIPDKWKKISGEHSKFVSLGGATEAGIWSNYFEVDKLEADWRSIPYGKALTNQAYRIVNKENKDCQPLEIGELWIGGDSLATGYFHEEALTKEKFITEQDGTRWYRTGDLGQFWEDGTIEFIGRIDAQVKIRGHRIELGEIESVYQKCKGIQQVAVVAIGDKYQKELVAFYTGEEKSVKMLEDYGYENLPEYSVPRKYQYMEQLPLSKNGKVDRKALMERNVGETEPAFESEEEQDEIFKLWEKVTGAKIKDSKENIFNLGADSLSATRFVEQVKKVYGVVLSIQDIFSNPTMEMLKERIQERVEKENTEWADEGEI